MSALEAVKIIEPMVKQLRDLRYAADPSCKASLRSVADDMGICLRNLKAVAFDEMQAKGESRG